MTALLDKPINQGDITFGIKISQADGSDPIIHNEGIHFESSTDNIYKSGYVTFESTDLIVSPGDTIEFIAQVNGSGAAAGGDDDIEFGPRNNNVSLMAHVAQSF